MKEEKKRVAGVQQITVKHGKVSKPAHVCLVDVLNFIENADRRETKIISLAMDAKAIGYGIGSVSFGDIGLANVLRFAGSANRRERAMIAEVVSHKSAVVSRKLKVENAQCMEGAL